LFTKNDKGQNLRSRTYSSYISSIHQYRITQTNQIQEYIAIIYKTVNSKG